MSLSRGLVISLGVSALGCTLLFLYFRNKIAGIERKVDVMFDLIQNHQFVQAEPTQVSSNTVRRENVDWVDNNNNLDTETNETQQETGAWSENAKSEDGLDLIQVSDDDDDDDSEEISDSDEEEQPKLSLDQTEEMSLSLSDIKKITVQETDKLQVDNTIELEEVDSLDEIEDDDDDDEEVEVEEMESKKVTVIKEDDDDMVDYAKLKVTELKALAEAKGLSNYKSLKKSPLIELLKASE